jgi:PAS domain S-box-containing protein
MKRNCVLQSKIAALEQLLDVQEQTNLEQIDKLVDSEKSFRSMFELTSEGVALIDPETSRIIGANPAMCALFGYTENEFSSLTPEDITAPEAKGIMRDALSRLRAGGLVADYEGVSVRKDGSAIRVIVRCRQLTWKGNRVFYVTFKDVTFLKDAQAKLEAKNRETVNLTNAIVHELKKPLSVMKTVHSLFKGGSCGSLNDRGREAIAISSETLTYMEEMLADLLANAQLEAGENTLAAEEFDLPALIREVVARLSYLTEGKNVLISIDATLGRITADKKGVTKIYMNLIGNALHYIGRGPDREIEIGAKALTGEKTFFVRDNGIGIPQDTQRTLFQKFKRGSNVGDISGTGLGLSIVKGIVEAHGGKVWVESAVNAGSTFYFTLCGP